LESRQKQVTDPTFGASGLSVRIFIISTVNNFASYPVAAKLDHICAAFIS
jgi:hypothetical protein